jgi:hypothetical protein
MGRAHQGRRLSRSWNARQRVQCPCSRQQLRDRRQSLVSAHCCNVSRYLHDDLVTDPVLL